MEASEADFIIQKVLLRFQELSQTPYACSFWGQLNGGTTNLVYRGILYRPLEQHNEPSKPAQKTVILKHAMKYVPGNKDFWLDVTRCVSSHACFPEPAARSKYVLYADIVKRKSRRICSML